jgi:hypothetical protein
MTNAHSTPFPSVFPALPLLAAVAFYGCNQASDRTPTSARSPLPIIEAEPAFSSEIETPCVLPSNCAGDQPACVAAGERDPPRENNLCHIGPPSAGAGAQTCGENVPAVSVPAASHTAAPEEVETELSDGTGRFSTN